MIKMARNPFVDGITNLAIPDSPYGVDLRGHEISGSLYGIESEVAYLNLSDILVKKRVFMRDMNIKGEVALNRAVFYDRTELTNTKIRKFLDISGMYAKELVLDEIEIGTVLIADKDTQIDDTLHIKDATIDGYNGPAELKTGGLEVNEHTKIPDNLKKALGLK